MEPSAYQPIRLDNAHPAAGEKLDDTMSLFPSEVVEQAHAPRVLHVTVTSPRTSTPEPIVFETVQPEWLIVTDDRPSQFDRVSEPWLLTMLREAAARWPYQFDWLGWPTLAAVLVISAAATLLLMRGPQQTDSKQIASEQSASEQITSDARAPREVPDSIPNVAARTTLTTYAPPTVPAFQSPSFAPPETRIDSPAPVRAAVSKDVSKTEAAPAGPVQQTTAPVQRNSIASAPASSKPPGTAQAKFQGRLIVDSNPQGATVQINQQAVGVTPLDLPRYRAASYAVWVEHEGYARWSAAVLVPADKVTRVKAQLERRQ